MCIPAVSPSSLVPGRDEAERLAGLRATTEHLIPGRWTAAREPNRKEMAATAVLALPLAEASVKTRVGGPLDEPDDYVLDVWAGVIPVRTVLGTPQPDPALPPGLPVPEHIRACVGRQPDMPPTGAM
jgi:uncharacterized protein